MLHPEAYIDFKVFEDSTDYAGIASVVLPNIDWMTQTTTGAGIGGEIETPLIGMLKAMELQIKFQSATGAAANLATPKKHQIELRAAEQYWDTVKVGREIFADKYALTVVPKSLSGGTVETAAQVSVDGTYSVYRYAAYKGSETLWELDPHNNICIMNGFDYLADVRKALGG